MARKKASVEDKLETFYFSIDDWFREYRFGINRHKWEYSPGHFDERDSIVILGTLRNRTRHKFGKGEMHLLPSEVPRNEWSDDVDTIGNVWVRDGILHWSAWIPADVFRSLTPAFAAWRIKEMSVTVRNLRYRRGDTDYVDLSHELTELDEDE